MENGKLENFVTIEGGIKVATADAIKRPKITYLPVSINISLKAFLKASHLFISFLPEEIPIAKSFVDLGFTQGQALTFMLASAGICIPTISATFKFFPRNLAIFYVLVWFIGSIIGGVIYDLMF